MRRFLSIIFVLISFGSLAQFPEEAKTSIKRGDITVTVLDEPGFTQIDTAGMEWINFGQQATSIDETSSSVLLDFNISDIPESIPDSVILFIGNQKFNMPFLNPMHIQGLEKGTYKLALSIYKGGKAVPLASNPEGVAMLTITSKEDEPLITNDAIVLGLLLIILALIFYTSGRPAFQKFYRIVPALLLCYFIPSFFNSAGVISGEDSMLYPIISRYLLPASLLLFCLGIDFKGIIRLGWRAITMFFAGTVGIIVGGPIAVLLVASVAPEVMDLQGEGEVWAGLSTVAGSWIGGGANQTAMKEVYSVGDELFSKMAVVDVLVANIWMGLLLYGAGISRRIDKAFKADASAISDLRERVEAFAKKMARMPSTTDLMVIFAIGIGGMGIAHFGADLITPIMEDSQNLLEDIGLTSLASRFFWIVVIATTIGLSLSFTRFRKYEGAGASRVASVFLYILVASIGMKMDILAIFDDPGLFVIGFIWMLVHVIVLFVVAKLIKAPFFYIAVGSQANVGGAASAPIVASAFSPSLAPVGVLLAVLGYAVGTYGAILCATLMQYVS